MKSPFYWMAVLFSLFLWSTVTLGADGDGARGEKLATTCLGCHGVESYFNTYPTYHVPKLGGQSAKYIESALKAYADGSRKHSTMHANAENLSEQDIADISAFMAQFGK